MSSCPGDLPDTSNRCNVSVGDLEPTPMPFFCTPLGSLDQRYNRSSEYCTAMSTGNEWVFGQGNNQQCCYTVCGSAPSEGYYQEIDCNSAGCVKSNPILICTPEGDPGKVDEDRVGFGMFCRRQSFTGQPITCCFKDYDCLMDNINCFSDGTGGGGNNTCADGKNGQPNYRNIASTDCQDALFDFCAGADDTTSGWLSRWIDDQVPGRPSTCLYALQKNINGLPGACTGPTPSPTGLCQLPNDIVFNAEGYFWAQQLIDAVMTHYEADGFVIGSLPGSSTWNPFQDLLYYGVCCPYAGLCQSGLNNICSRYTAQRISFNPSVTQWCGCHLPIGEYQDYSVKYNIPPECSPPCNRFGTIPITGINAQPITCKQDICLIDDVTINLISSEIGGGIDFNQICGNCGGGQCSCIAANNTIDIENSTINGNFVPFSQGCNVSNCSQTNPGTTGPAVINVACGATGGYNPYTEYEQKVLAAQTTARKNSIIWTILIVALAILAIFLIIYFLYPTQ